MWRESQGIRAYLDRLHDRVERENIHVNIWAQCNSPHLTDELLIVANQQWQQAENLVAAEPEVLRRVKLSRMSVDYAILERGRLQALRKLPVNERFRPLVGARFNPFFDVLWTSKLNRLNEWNLLNKETYRRDLAKDLRMPL